MEFSSILNFEQPKWVMQVTPNFFITQYKRPLWLHRVFLRLVFGFKWRPNNV